jgi:hypothetical protein
VGLKREPPVGEDQALGGINEIIFLESVEELGCVVPLKLDGHEQFAKGCDPTQLG